MDERGAARRPVLDSRVRGAPGASATIGRMAGRALLLRAEPGFSLPAFERFAPTPAARARRRPARGGVASPARSCSTCSAAAAGSRGPRSTCSARAISLESTPLDRLLAEIVLRPPDLRHLDAAVQALAASARRESSLKASITDRFASRCATCDRPGRPRRADLDGRGRRTRTGRCARPQPVRKHYRCPVCRDQLGGGEQRQAPLDAQDLAPRPRPARASSCAARSPTGSRCSRAARTSPRELLDLHTPRQLSAFGAILERIEDDLRAAPIEAALRLALLHALAPASRLATSPGRLAPLRIASGHVKPSRARRSGASATRGSRSRTASGSSAASSSGWRAARGARCRRASATTCGASSRGRRPRSSSRRRRRRSGRSSSRPSTSSRGGARPRIRLVARHAAAPPVADRLAWAYHGTAWVLGREAAATLPLEPLFGPAVRPSWGVAGGGDHADAARRRAGPREGRPDRVPARGRRDRRRSSRRVLGGVTAGYRLAAARLPEAGRETRRRRGARAAGLGRRPRRPADAGERRARRRCRAAPATRTSCPPSGCSRPPSGVVDAPFSAQDAARGRRRRRGRRAQAPRRAGDLRPGCWARSSSASIGPAISAASCGRRRAAEAARRRRAPGRAGRSRVDHVDRLLSPSSATRSTGADGPPAGEDRRRPLVARRPRPTATRPRPRSPTASSGRCTACCRPPARCPRPRSSSGSRACSPAPTCPTRRSSAPASTATAASPARRTGSSPPTTSCKRSQEHGELIADLVDLGHRLGLLVLDRRRASSRAASAASRSADRLDDREHAGPPYFGRIRGEDLEDVDVIWYVRGRAACLWEVEWTAMLGEPVLRRHARMADRRARRAVPRRAPRAQRARPPQARPLAAAARRARGRRAGTSSRRTTSATGRGARSWRSRTSSRSSASTRTSSGPATSWRCSADSGVVGRPPDAAGTRATLGRVHHTACRDQGSPRDRDDDASRPRSTRSLRVLGGRSSA